jgi:uncharacterized protein
MQLGYLYIDDIPQKGRGVRTLRPFSEGEIIEICPVLVLPPQDRAHIKDTLLFHYYFEWGDDESQSAIALGYGSMYNHSPNANAHYDMDFEAQTLTIFCVRPIKTTEEITINYNGEIDNQDKVWFEMAEK